MTDVAMRETIRDRQTISNLSYSIDLARPDTADWFDVMMCLGLDYRWQA